MALAVDAEADHRHEQARQLLALQQEEDELLEAQGLALVLLALQVRDKLLARGDLIALGRPNQERAVVLERRGRHGPRAHGSARRARCRVDSFPVKKSAIGDPTHSSTSPRRPRADVPAR